MNTRSQLLLVLPFLLARTLAQDAPPTGGDDPFRKAAQTAAARPATPSTLPPLKLVFETYTLDPMLAREVLVKDGPVKAYARARELAQAGQAKLAQSVTVVTSSGHRVVSEEIREIIYPTEWTPPQLTRPQEKSKSSPQKVKGKPPVSAETDPTPPPWINGFWIENPTPTAFATRNVGLTIEAGPSKRGAFCDSSLAIDTVRHLGDREVSPGTKVVQPTFESRRVRINSAFPLGVPSLLGTLNGPAETGVPDQDTRQPATLVFVTATSNAPTEADATSAELPVGVFTAVVEIYSMAAEKALATSKETGTAAIERTLASVAEGSARLEEIFALRGLAASNVSMGSLQEFKYPTQWDPAVLSPGEAKRWPQIPAIFSLPSPQAIDTRNVGIEAEIGAKPELDGSWMIATVANSVRLVGQREAALGSNLFHPTFETRKLSTEMRVAVGKTTLLGSFSAQTADEENASGGLAPLTARIAEPKERDRAWLAFITIHGAAVEPPATRTEVAKSPDSAKSGAQGITNTPRVSADPQATPPPAPGEELIIQYYDLTKEVLDRLPDREPKLLRDYLSKADVAFPPGSGISVFSEDMLFARNTRANLDRVEAILGAKPSTKLFEESLTVPNDFIDPQLLDEVPRPAGLAEPIPEKVWSCKKQLERLGIESPEGSYSVYLRNSKRLFISNTRTNVDRVRELIGRAGMKRPAN